MFKLEIRCWLQRLKDITSLKSKIISPCSSDIHKVEELGNASLKNFVKEGFIDNKRSVFDPIKQNNTGFFKKTAVKDTTRYQSIGK